MERLAKVSQIVAAVALSLSLFVVGSASSASLPEGSTKVLPLASEDSISTFLPSKSAPGRGLAVNIIYPERPRYADGAPIAVVVPGGDAQSGLEFSMHAAQVGFIEIRFAFPGGGTKSFSSSGCKDYRGLLSQQALRDVLLFAMGKGEDRQGRTLKELVPIKVAANNVGLVGWSNGGNLALVTMDKFAEPLATISWIAFYESPLGSLFYPPNLGGCDDLVLNKHYREGSAATGRCLIDFRNLAFDPDARRNPGVGKKLGELEVPGVVYFDDNGNKRWDEATEFAFHYSTGGTKQQLYPPEVTAALERLKIFDKHLDKNGDEVGGWPESVAKVEVSDQFYQDRDGALFIPSICAKYPRLLVTICGSRVDHLQRQPDHPHILFQYNAWLDNGVRWVRLNPEPIYLQVLAQMNMRNFPNNLPNASLEPEEVDSLLEPEAILKDYIYMNACVAELADRVKTKNLASPLMDTLVSYTNGALSPSASTAKAASGDDPHGQPLAKPAKAADHAK